LWVFCLGAVCQLAHFATVEPEALLETSTPIGHPFPMQRSSLRTLVLGAASSFALGVIAASCGGSVAPIGDDDAGSDADGSTSDGASDAGAGGDVTDVGTKDSGNSGSSCDSLRLQIDKLREAATRCCPTCKSIQCQDQAKDLCCPLTVTSAGSPEAQKLQAAVIEYAQKGCDVACPAVPCQVKASGICDPVTSHCQR
jgi:hypothetical protein